MTIKKNCQKIIVRTLLMSKFSGNRTTHPPHLGRPQPCISLLIDGDHIVGWNCWDFGTEALYRASMHMVLSVSSALKILHAWNDKGPNISAMPWGIQDEDWGLRIEEGGKWPAYIIVLLSRFLIFFYLFFFFNCIIITESWHP